MRQQPDRDLGPSGLVPRPTVSFRSRQFCKSCFVGRGSAASKVEGSKSWRPHCPFGSTAEVFGSKWDIQESCRFRPSEGCLLTVVDCAQIRRGLLRRPLGFNQPEESFVRSGSRPGNHLVASEPSLCHFSTFACPPCPSLLRVAFNSFSRSYSGAQA